MLSVCVLCVCTFERIDGVTNLAETLNVTRSDTSEPVVIYLKSCPQTV
jgi:hypothetical protein